MIITHFAYDKVTITYDEPVPRANGKVRTEEVWRTVQIHFKGDKTASTLELHGEREQFILLGNARVIELTPWGAKFEAYWWQSHPSKCNKDGKLSKRQPRGFKRLVRANVVCEF